MRDRIMVDGVGGEGIVEKGIRGARIISSEQIVRGEGDRV
jgi:hypothetical protein